jgi:hypothetical protein
VLYEIINPVVKANRAELTAALVLLVLLIGGAAGAWVWVSTTDDLDWELRTPAGLPDWLASSEILVFRHLTGSLDIVTVSLQRFTSESEPNAILGEFPDELAITADQREPVDVDGVQGWLWHLSLDDLAPPRIEGEHIMYARLRGYRRQESPAKLENGSYTPTSSGGFISGPAISVQWNRDGVLNVLIAQDVEPMNEDVLLSIANSLKPTTEYRLSN